MGQHSGPEGKYWSHSMDELCPKLVYMINLPIWLERKKRKGVQRKSKKKEVPEFALGVWYCCQSPAELISVVYVWRMVSFLLLYTTCSPRHIDMCWLNRCLEVFAFHRHGAYWDILSVALWKPAHRSYAPIFTLPSIATIREPGTCSLHPRREEQQVQAWE